MRSLVTIADVTRMHGSHVCVAGYRPDLACVRPVFEYEGIDERWLFVRGRLCCRPFARLELDFQRRPRHLEAPHLEDWIVGRRFVDRGLLDDAERRALLNEIVDPSVRSIFGTDLAGDPSGARWVAAGTGTRSLGTVEAAVVGVDFGPRPPDKRAYRLAFRDRSDELFRVAVTDLAFRSYLDHLHDRSGGYEPAARAVRQALGRGPVFVRLGLARGWELRPDRCYLQVTGVYSFPDYLDGRSFADFVPLPDDRALLADVPF